MKGMNLFDVNGTELHHPEGFNFALDKEKIKIKKFKCKVYSILVKDPWEIKNGVTPDWTSINFVTQRNIYAQSKGDALEIFDKIQDSCLLEYEYTKAVLEDSLSCFCYHDDKLIYFYKKKSDKRYSVRPQALELIVFYKSTMENWHYLRDLLKIPSMLYPPDR